jgi:hypothetical protein
MMSSIVFGRIRSAKGEGGEGSGEGRVVFPDPVFEGGIESLANLFASDPWAGEGLFSFLGILFLSN